MEPTQRALILSLCCLALILTACPTEQSDPGPTGPPGQPDTAWAQQMSERHKAQQATEREAKYKNHRERGLKLAKDPAQGVQAIGYLESALNLAGKLGKAEGEQKELKQNLAKVHLDQANKAMDAQDYATARVGLLKAQQHNTGLEGIAAGLARIKTEAQKRLKRAAALPEKKRTEAIKLLAEVLSMSDPADPLHQEANTLRGKLLEAKEKAARDADVASGNFDKAGATDALTRSKALRADGIELQQKGEYAEAIERYKEALDLNPDDHDLNRLIGSCYNLLNDRKKAITYYKRYTLRCDGCLHVESVKKVLEKLKSQKF